MPPRRYHYVGPAEIKARVTRDLSHCRRLDSLADLETWIATRLPVGRSSGKVSATFTVDIEGRLWIADRRSEHVACADGGEVQAAGELTFEKGPKGIRVEDASNLSTGYCPEPACWEVVAAALAQLDLARPDDFTMAFEFRRCSSCRSINVIKDGVLECDVCGESLPPEWNFS